MSDPTIPGSASKPERLYFQANEREWVRRKWRLVRGAMKTADQAVLRWRRVSEEVNDHLDRHDINDMVQRIKIRAENLTLADAISTSTWFRQEAQAHMDDLNLYLRLKELGLL